MMTILKSQTETVNDPVIDESVLSIKKNENPQGNFDSSLMAGLMLGMQLRESLSEQDRSLLNRLAPPNRSVFLVHRGRFVHPENFDAFPLEHIDSCVGEQAFFSHRFRPEGEHTGQATTIQTAVINQGDPNSLLFGWFGSEQISDDNWDHRFSKLVAELRNAYSESAGLAKRLQAQFNTAEPTLLVDHETGRLLHLNKSAADLCEQKPSTMVDLHFEQVRALLGRTLTNRRLIMKRVTAGNIKVTMVTLPLIKESKDTNNRVVVDYREHTSEEKLASIIMAAELLKSSLSNSGDKESIELSDIIATEARELDDMIYRQRLSPGDVDTENLTITEMRNDLHKILETQ